MKRTARFWRQAPAIGLLVIGSLSPALPETPDTIQPTAPVKLAPPHVADIPNNDVGKQILLGRRLLAETRKSLPNYVGDVLNCNSCHLSDGRVARPRPTSARRSIPTPQSARRKDADDGRAHQRLLTTVDERQGFAGKTLPLK